MNRKNLKNNEPPFFKFIEFLKLLMNFCLMGGICSFIAFLFVDNEFNKGEWLGISVTCLLIYISFIIMVVNMIPKDQLDEMMDEIEREIDRKEKEKGKDDKGGKFTDR